MFSPATSEVQKARLSFYNGIDVFKLTNFASLPSFTFEYLGDGVHFHYLDGTETPIYTINDRGHLALNERSVIDYLEFFFAHVTVEDEEMCLIRSVHDMPLLGNRWMLTAWTPSAVTTNNLPSNMTRGLIPIRLRPMFMPRNS